MENKDYQEFTAMNAAFLGGSWTEKMMEKNWEIARNTINKFREKYPDDNTPHKGDMVEFSDGFQIYKYAKIVEDLYGKEKFGILTICENGSSFMTSGGGLCTSGGAFIKRSKTVLKPAGYDTNIFWTWGCNGAGANHGIYFKMKVRKWLIPYDKDFMTRSTVKIHGKNKKNFYGNVMPAVVVENIGDMYAFQTFESIKAYKEWAKLTGYVTKQRESCLDLISCQILEKKFITKDEDIPEGTPKIKCAHNGQIRDCWVKTDGHAITYMVDNRHKEQPKYGSKEEREERELFWKYADNPLGV